jgi:hypothetical protein
MKSTRPSLPAATPSKPPRRPQPRPSRQPVPSSGYTGSGATPDATGATAVLEAQVAGLREIGDLLRRQLDEAREDRDRWRSQAEASQRLIPGQVRRPWWRRIAGRDEVKLIALLVCILVMLRIIADQLK